ncbi:hypothetical protein GCM10009793_25910 [Brachybacterium phenoliresistens]
MTAFITGLSAPTAGAAGSARIRPSALSRAPVPSGTERVMVNLLRSTGGAGGGASDRAVVRWCAGGSGPTLGTNGRHICDNQKHTCVLVR